MFKMSIRIADLSLRAGLVALAIVAPVLILKLAEVGSWSRIAAWACSLLGQAGLFTMAGVVIRGRVLGVLVDERNRYSLSRLQITLWTMLVLATLYVVFVSNLMLPDGWVKALDVDLNLNLVLLMGFSVASFAVAPLASSRKAGEVTDTSALAREAPQLAATQKLDAVPAAAGSLLIKRSPTDARLADLIRGEEVGNAGLVDLPRTQMLIITVVVVLCYGGAVAAALYQGGTNAMSMLPELSGTLLGLIGISHGGYLAGKLIPSGAGTSAEQLGRALQASQRATAVASDFQAKFNASGAADPRYRLLQDGLAQAQATAAEAATLPGRSTASGFRPEETATVEGRIDALQTILRSYLGKAQAPAVEDAPAEETVRAVQRKLAALGHAVPVTGVADAVTEEAIGKQLAKDGLTRADLHPRAYRYFEELAALI